LLLFSPEIFAKIKVTTLIMKIDTL